jgi:serine/threonine protein kinase
LLPETSPREEHLGRRLGDFVLGARIGQGAFGAIYLAEQIGLERQVVVKVLHAHRAADRTAQLRFLREARLAATLDHPYAAHVYASGVEHDGVLWIAMELVRGTPLDKFLRAQPMRLRDLVPFLERLCEVVHTAHEHGIVHRDIKPKNVMVITRAGALMPKLLDLGIATHASFPTQSSSPWSVGEKRTASSTRQRRVLPPQVNRHPTRARRARTLRRTLGSPSRRRRTARRSPSLRRPPRRSRATA